MIIKHPCLSQTLALLHSMVVHNQCLLPQVHTLTIGLYLWASILGCLAPILPIIKAALYTVRCKLHIGLQKVLNSQAHLTSPKAGQTGMNSCTVDFSQDMLIVYGVIENVVQMLSSTHQRKFPFLCRPM
jgi:hypothetical protein